MNFLKAIANFTLYKSPDFSWWSWPEIYLAEADPYEVRVNSFALW